MRTYICSTYVDLAEHRKAAINALNEFNIHAKESWDMMDYFDPNGLSGRGAPPVDIYLKKLKESGFFALILGWRYGYVPTGSDKSLVELEYDAAIEANLPCFCFIIDDAFPVPPKYVEAGEGAKKLERLKQRVREHHMVTSFSTPSDLARAFTLAISVINRPIREAMQAIIEHSALKTEYRRHREEVKYLREALDGYKEKLIRLVPADPIWRGRRFVTDDSLGFVMIPFSDSFFTIYEEAIIPALESAGLRSIHAGEIFSNHVVMEDIWEAICTAKIVIADVTGRNPNVFYELGIAHTLGKECIVLTQDSQDVPFDIRARRFIEYDPRKNASLRASLEKTIKAILLS